MRNMVLSAFTAVAAMFVFASFAETVVQWTGKGGDMDLTNEQNWPDDTLPESPTYGAKLTATAEENPYTMLKATSLLSYTINLADSLTLDLGKGNSFLSAYKVYVNTTDKTYNLKSGTFGVDWDSSDGERFFIGDSGSGGNTFNASGEDTVLMSSKKSSLQVGTNQGRQRLNVTDGATLQANIVMGNGSGARSNVTYIANATHVVPSTSTATPLTVGALGGWNTYILTNGASFASERAANVYMPGSINHTKGGGHNRIVVSDHSSFSSVYTVDIGYCGDDNGVILDGGSTLTCKVLNLATEVDQQASPIVNGNFIRASGAGTKIRTTSNFNVGGLSTDTVLWLNDGAELMVDDTLTLGTTACTNLFAYFGTNVVVDVKNGISFDARPGKTVFDGATLFYTNQVNAARVVYFGNYGRSNAVEFVNGAYGLFNSPGGGFYISRMAAGADGSLTVRGEDTLLQLYDQTVSIGTEAGSSGGLFRIDGGTVAITNLLSKRTFAVGNMGSRNMLEVTNGGLLTFSNVSFVVCANRGEGSNVVRVANGGRITGLITNGDPKEGIYIGQYVPGGLDVDGGSFVVPQILRVSHTEANGGGSWVKIRNGGYVEVNRVIMGEMTQGNRIDIDNGTLVTLGDSLQMGTSNAACSNDVLTITGTNAFVRSGGSLSISPHSLVQFDFGEFGFCKTAAVVRVASNVNGTTTVTEENPVTIRITDDNPKRIEGGKYTLIETKNGTIAWDKINLEYPPSVRIVEKTDKKLVVRVPSRKGMMLILR